MRSVTVEEVPADHLPRVDERRTPSLALVVAAFAGVYLIWGSTFMAISVAIHAIPPLLMAGGRWIIAGTLLYTVLRLRGVPKPEPIHWRNAALVGALLLGFGNGGMTWAQMQVPSGIAALVIAAMPLWMILFDWLQPRGKRPHGLVFVGLALGFVGVALIILGKDHGGNRVVPFVSGAALLLATLTWAVGSIWSRHLRHPDHPLMAGATQMLCAGVLLVGASGLTGEFARFHPSAITHHSAVSFVYLALIGSLVGFTCYAWLLRVSTPARVSTYAYVNPLIAVVLGRVFLDEPLPHTVLFAGAAILGGVILITLRGHR